MQTSKKQFRTVDEYIATHPIDMRKRLKLLRQTIREAAPGASQVISYDMPAFKMESGYLLAFAAWKNHIAMYPVPSGSAAFNKEISRYVAHKSTIQFPHDKPLPLALIRKIVKYRMKDNLKQNREKKK